MSDPADDEPPGVPEWVVTYGDMMSLLLTFFIMLVSMSEMKEEGSMRAMMDAIREVFGPTDGRMGVPGKSLQTTSIFRYRGSTGERMEGGTKKSSANSDGPRGAHSSVKRINHGSFITLGGPTTFRRFDAELTVEMQESLDVIARVIQNKPNKLIVRGHASPEPLAPDASFRDQLDLSFARAQNVAQYLVAKGIDRRRVLVSAAGDTEPRLLTRDREQQKHNRRVDVFLIDSYITRPDSSESTDR